MDPLAHLALNWKSVPGLKWLTSMLYLHCCPHEASYTSRAPKCGVVTKMHFSLGGRLAVNGIQLGTQQLIITAVAVADPRLKQVQTPSGNTL